MFRAITTIFGILFASAIAAMGTHAYLQWQADLQRPQIDPERGVDLLTAIEVNGSRQWVHARGADRQNPVLLFLHGGPGTAMIPFSAQFQNEWEQAFTVVHWDQRGSGKTYWENLHLDAGAPTFDDMLSDAEVVVEWARSTFAKAQIWVLGHSWGTMLAAPLVHKHPEWFAGYVATGVVVDIVENERRGYRHTVELATQMDHAEALAALTDIAPYPEPDGTTPGDETDILRRWQTEFGVGISRRYAREGIGALAQFALRSPEYSLRDMTYFLRNTNAQWQNVNTFIDTYEARRYGTRYAVPVFFLLGRHDWQTPSTLAAEFFDEIQSPTKHLVWLEESAHTPFVDEPEAFANALLRLPTLLR